MRSFAICTAVVCVVATLAVAAPAPKETPAYQKLVGTWKLLRSSQGIDETVNFFVEFTKDGKMLLKITPKDGGETTTLKGTYKYADDKIDYTMETGDGNTRTEILTVKKLTENDLVTTDPDNIKEEFERARPEAKEKEKKEKEKE